MPGFEESYLGQLRKLVGTRMLITSGVNAVVRDDGGRVLLIRRRDNLNWALPGGGMELEQSVYDCLVREVKEETGLDVISATLFATYSEARFVRKDMWGNYSQPIILAFKVDEWRGTLSTDTDETVDARFVPAGQVPEPYVEVMEDLARFDGQVILK
jgi:8-oxo-dGTP pyrophosphatase MutT (NUDIX family)